MKKTFPFFALSLVIVSFGVQVSSAYSQGRALTQGIEHLLRIGSRNPPNFRRAYEIVGNGVAVVTTANGAYRIYVDCKQGMASESITNLPSDQQASLIRDMCGKYLR